MRTKRGLAYGAYMTLGERRGAGAAAGWVFSGTDKTVATLKLVLKLYVSLMEWGVTTEQVGSGGWDGEISVDGGYIYLAKGGNLLRGSVNV